MLIGGFWIGNNQIERPAKERRAEKHRHTLRAMEDEAFASKLVVTFPPKRRDLLNRNTASRFLHGSAVLAHQRNPPRREPLPDLSRECARIGCGNDRSRRQNSARLMLAVARVHATPSVDDHSRPKRTKHSDHVLERHVAPDFHSLIGALRIASVYSACEELLDAVVLARRQQFRRAKNPKAFTLLGANRILSALAARQREQ